MAWVRSHFAALRKAAAERERRQREQAKAYATLSRLLQTGFALLHETATRSVQAAFVEMRREEAAREARVAAAQAKLAEGQTLFEHSKYQKAVRVLKEAQQLDPDNTAVAEWLSRAQEKAEYIEPEPLSYVEAAKLLNAISRLLVAGLQFSKAAVGTVAAASISTLPADPKARKKNASDDFFLVMQNDLVSVSEDEFKRATAFNDQEKMMRKIAVFLDARYDETQPELEPEPEPEQIAEPGSDRETEADLERTSDANFAPAEDGDVQTRRPLTVMKSAVLRWQAVEPPEGMPALPFRWHDGPDPDPNAKRHWYSWKTIGEEREAAKNKAAHEHAKMEAAAQKQSAIENRVAAELALEYKNWKEAERLLLIVREVDPADKHAPTFSQSTDALLLRAQLGQHAQQGDVAFENQAMQAAVEAYEKCLELDPANKSGWDPKPKLKKAKDFLEKQRKERIARQRADAEGAIKQKEYAQASELLSELAELDPEDKERPAFHEPLERLTWVARVGAVYDEAEELLKNEKFDEAVAKFEKCVTIDPEARSGLKLQARLDDAKARQAKNLVFPWE